MKGDSGGGLYVFDNSLNKYVVSGITSYGNGNVSFSFNLMVKTFVYLFRLCIERIRSVR